VVVVPKVAVLAKPIASPVARIAKLIVNLANPPVRIAAKLIKAIAKPRVKIVRKIGNLLAKIARENGRKERIPVSNKQRIVLTPGNKGQPIAKIIAKTLWMTTITGTTAGAGMGEVMEFHQVGAGLV
jgi:hypothetical protein